MNGEIKEYFKKFQEQTVKYQDLDIDSVKFETKRITSSNEKDLVCKKRMGFTPKKTQNGDINWFTVKDLTNNSELFINNPNTKEKTTVDLVKQAIDKKGTGKSEKLISIKKGDVLVSFKLTVGVVKIYNSDLVAYCNEAIDILTPQKNIYNKYLAYNCMIEYPRYGTQTNNGLTLNDNDKRLIQIKIPKPLTTKTKTYSSYEIQEAIVEFLEFNKTKSDNFREFIKKIKKYIKNIEDGLLSSIFNQNDDYIKEKFRQFYTNQKQKKDKKNIVDFGLEDIEFEEISAIKSNDYFKIFNGQRLKKSNLKQDNIDLIEPIVVYSASESNKEVFGYIEKEKLKSINPNQRIYKGRTILLNTGGSVGAIRFKDNNFDYTVIDNVIIYMAYKNVCLDSYLYFNLVFSMKNKQFDYLNTLRGKNLEKANLKFKLPKPLTTKTKTYSSYEVQEAIVAFINRFYEWKKEIYSNLEKVEKIINDIDEQFLTKTFEE